MCVFGQCCRRCLTTLPNRLPVDDDVDGGVACAMRRPNIPFPCASISDSLYEARWRTMAHAFARSGGENELVELAVWFVDGVPDSGWAVGDVACLRIRCECIGSILCAFAVNQKPTKRHTRKPYGTLLTHACDRIRAGWWRADTSRNANTYASRTF